MSALKVLVAVRSRTFRVGSEKLVTASVPAPSADQGRCGLRSRTAAYTSAILHANDVRKRLKLLLHMSIGTR